MQALTAQLGTDPPPAVAQLKAEHLDHLSAAIRSARQRQAAELGAAGTQALNTLPRLLRGPVKKIVGQ